VNIYNPKGQKIRTLSRNSLQQGEHSLIWNGKDHENNSVASGVYLYRLQVDGKTKATSKCLLLK
jgi:flagellar hook assembly protein FlgD